MGSSMANMTGSSAASASFGAVPAMWVCCETTVSGVSTARVASIFIPFRSPQASVSLPSTITFWPLGSANWWCDPPAT